jgi:DNA-binding NarL/FixJ family response regulator
VIKVVLADDQVLVRSGFRLLLDSAEDIQVIGEAADGTEALALVDSMRPDVVLMDIRMPGMDGLEATARIAGDDRLTGVKVLVLTTYEDDDNIFAALRAGAGGFVTKDVELPDLVQAIKVVARGDALLSPSVTRRVIAEAVGRIGRPSSPAPVLGALTDREREVLALVGRGMSNDEIAQQLFLSPLTAKTHVSRAMTKLGVRDRAQLVVVAYESGLVVPGQ